MKSVYHKEQLSLRELYCLDSTLSLECTRKTILVYTQNPRCKRSKL